MICTIIALSPLILSCYNPTTKLDSVVVVDKDRAVIEECRKLNSDWPVPDAHIFKRKDNKELIILRSNCHTT